MKSAFKTIGSLLDKFINKWHADILILIYFVFASIVFDLTGRLLYFSATGTPVCLDATCWGYIYLNLIIFMISIIIVLIIPYRYLVYALVAILFGIIGYLFSVYFSIGIITVVWHGALGAFAGLSLLYRDSYADLKAAIDRTENGETEKINSLKEDIRILINCALNFFSHLE